MNYYDILGVPRYATFDQIKSAYRQQIKFFHPDVFDGIPEVADIKTRQLNEAYEILSNPQLRFEYDKKLYSEDKQFIEELQAKCNFYQAQANGNTSYRNSQKEERKPQNPNRRKNVHSVGTVFGIFALISVFAAFFYAIFATSGINQPSAQSVDLSQDSIQASLSSETAEAFDPTPDSDSSKREADRLKELADQQWQAYINSAGSERVGEESESSAAQGIPVHENPPDLSGEEYRAWLASRPKTAGQIAWESQKETWESSDSEQDNTSTPSSFIQEKAEESRERVDEKYGSGYYGSSDYRTYNPSGTPALQTPKDSSSDLTALLKPSNEEVLYKRDDLAEYTSEIIVHASDESDCVVKLKSHSTGTTMYAFYVKSGRTAEKPIPPGTYDVCFAFGVKWYGYENLFGEYTSCSKDENIEFIYGTAWEYTLTPVQFGNLTLDDMDLADMLDD